MNTYKHFSTAFKTRTKGNSSHHGDCYCDHCVGPGSKRYEENKRRMSTANAIEQDKICRGR
jgi:hypothetical protein